MRKWMAEKRALQDSSKITNHRRNYIDMKGACVFQGMRKWKEVKSARSFTRGLARCCVLRISLLALLLSTVMYFHETRIDRQRECEAEFPLINNWECEYVHSRLLKYIGITLSLPYNWYIFTFAGGLNAQWVINSDCEFISANHIVW